ncbi:MAG TPA: hypothetical protein VKY51_00985 [Fredinandcohnia sp.]|nr:hypothetical protein [Fredinandcohnia sp.]
MRARTVLIALGALLIVSGAVVWMARVGAKNLVGSGQVQAEKSAVATLRALHWAQGIFRQRAYLDADGNGEGEFGTLRQLAAADPLPSGSTIPAPLTPGGPAQLDGELLVTGGYCFRIDLPEGTHARERRFVAWAWPMLEGIGTRRYCLDQDEQIWEAPAGPHVGCQAGPPPSTCPPDAGFVRWRGKTNLRPVGAKP